MMRDSAPLGNRFALDDFPAALLFAFLLAIVTGTILADARGRPAAPQVPPAQRPTFSTDVEVVNVLVTVRDKDGKVVRDLSQDDFVVTEDGRPQNIRYFFRESDLPLSIGLLVDTTPSESKMLDTERRASLAFLTSMLRPEKDVAFVAQYHQQFDLLQGFTSSIDDLTRAMWGLEAHALGGGPTPGSPQRPGGPSGYETALADAVIRSSNDIMASQQGRKALFILGDGDHLGNRGEQAIADAQQAETLIYAIRIYDKALAAATGTGGLRLPGGITIGGTGPGGGFGGVGTGPGGGARPGGPGQSVDPSRWKENLQMLSKRTGGAYYEVGKKLTLDQIYAAIEEELRSQYTLGYTPDAQARPGYRRIKIEVRRKGVNVRAREGYYARGK